MAIPDKQLELDAPLTALTATRASTNYYINVGNGDLSINTQPLYIQAYVDTALTSGGASTLTVTVETDDNSSFSSAEVLLTTGSIAKASLVKGYELFNAKLPHGVQKYLRLNYTVGTADFTAGTVNGRISTSMNTRYNYPL